MKRIAVLGVAALSLLAAFCAEVSEEVAKHGAQEMNKVLPHAEVHAAGGAFRVLVMGNSITRHGIAPHLGWTNCWGMAASAREKDFPHRVIAGLEAMRGEKADWRIENVCGLIERRWHDLDVLHDLKDELAYRPDYVVLAFGENAHFDKAKEGEWMLFRDKVAAIIRAFRSRKGPAPEIVIRGTFWDNAEKARAFSEAAQATGCRHVACGDIGADASNRAEGLFAHPGVAAHPGDLGMERLARRVTCAFMHPNDAPYDVTFEATRVSVHPVRVSACPYNRAWPGQQRAFDQTRAAYFVNFDMASAGTLRVRFADAELAARAQASLAVRPARAPVRVAASGTCLTIAVSQTGFFALDFGAACPTLHVFANPPSTAVAKAGEIHFGPGVHEAGMICPGDGQQVRLDDGAYVYGAILVDGKRDVSVVGRGVLDASRMTRTARDGRELSVAQDAIRAGKARWDHDSTLFTAYAATNLHVEGVTFVDAPFWTVIVRNGCKGVTFDNIKIVGSWRYNADGIDICTSSDVAIRNSFVRSFDDCIVARGAHLADETRPVDGMRVENCLLWCDWGKNMEVWAGTKPCAIRNVVFANNTCIANGASTIADVTTWGGACATRIENIAFDNTQVDVIDPMITNQYQKDEAQRFDWAQRRSWLSLACIDAPQRWRTKAPVDIRYRDICVSGMTLLGYRPPQLLVSVDTNGVAMTGIDIKGLPEGVTEQ